MAIVLTINNTTVFWQYDWLLDRSRGLHALRFTLYVWRSPPLLHVSLLRFYAVRFCAFHCVLLRFTLFALRFTPALTLSLCAFTLYTLRFRAFTFYALHFALFALRFTLCALRFTLTTTLIPAVLHSLYFIVFYSLSLSSLFYTDPLTLTLYYSLSYTRSFMLALFTLFLTAFPLPTYVYLYISFGQPLTRFQN